jgi:hypothetical protein
LLFAEIGHTHLLDADWSLSLRAKIVVLKAMFFDPRSSVATMRSANREMKLGILRGRNDELSSGSQAPPMSWGFSKGRNEVSSEFSG